MENETLTRAQEADRTLCNNKTVRLEALVIHDGDVCNFLTRTAGICADMLNHRLPGQQMAHYWDVGSASYYTVSELATCASNYDQEDIVAHAWTEIARNYFPGRTLTGESWAVQREAYRGVYGSSEIKPDIITIKYTPHPQGGALHSDAIIRDYLNIECKAPMYNTPSGWKDCIIEATDSRLERYSANMDVFLCIAVGRFYMFFVWCPSNPLQNPLWLEGRTFRQEFDPRLRSFPGPWVDFNTGEVKVRRALACNNDDVVGRTVIENVLLAIRGTVLPGENS